MLENNVLVAVRVNDEQKDEIHRMQSVRPHHPETTPAIPDAQKASAF